MSTWIRGEISDYFCWMGFFLQLGRCVPSTALHWQSCGVVWFDVTCARSLTAAGVTLVCTVALQLWAWQFNPHPPLQHQRLPLALSIYSTHNRKELTVLYTIISAAQTVWRRLGSKLTRWRWSHATSRQEARGVKCEARCQFACCLKLETDHAAVAVDHGV